MGTDRRGFVRAGVAATGLMAGLPSVGWSRGARPGGRTFRLRYAPHFGMFQNLAGTDLVKQLEFVAAEGFRALEDNDMRVRPVAEQQRIAAAMERLDLAMGVFVGHTINWSAPTLTSGNAEARARFVEEITASVEVAKRVRATWMTVVPGYVDPRLDLHFQTANVVEALKRAAAVLEPHGLVMVLEPLNTLRNHPGMFLTRIPQTYAICKAVASPACKILYDIYHQQITEGNLIPNFTAAWDEVAYVQVGDNPGRREPGTGEINYRGVFTHLRDRGYTGIIGMEHGNSRPGAEGERAVIDAYVAADPG